MRSSVMRPSPQWLRYGRRAGAVESTLAAHARASMTSEVMDRPREEPYGASMTTTTDVGHAGDLLRRWRQQRRLTQLELSHRAHVSTRHLSFVETGKSSPSRELLLHLADHLDVPLRERNVLLLAAGLAPAYSEHDLTAPDLTAVRRTIDRILEAHEPYPALVVDRWWDLVAANASAGALMAGIDPALAGPPLNVLRASLHPDGLAPRIRNLGQWRAHVLHRLRTQIARTGDPRLASLADELAALGPKHPIPHPTARDGGVAVPLIIAGPDGDLRFLSTISTFGTALDVTADDLSIESFFPADEATRTLLLARAAAR